MTNVLDTPEWREEGRKLQAMAKVLDQIKVRDGSKAPSNTVVVKAAGMLIEGGRITDRVGTWQMRYVEGENGRYRVMIQTYGQGRLDESGRDMIERYRIIDAECSCSYWRAKNSTDTTWRPDDRSNRSRSGLLPPALRSRHPRRHRR